MNARILAPLIFILLFFHGISHATVYRVNNTGADADYTTAQAAHDAASSGDTLYIEGSPTSYGNLNITKEVHIFGAGYFLSQNLGLQASPLTSGITTLSLGTNCDNTTIQGMVITYVGSVNTSSTFSDISISRSHISGIYLYTNGLINNFFLTHNYIIGVNSTYSSITTSGAGSKTLVIANNIFGNASYSRINLGPEATAVFVNNTFNTTTFSSYSCVLQNNIMLSGTINASSGPTNVFENNICTGTQFPSGNGNQQNVDASIICVGFPTQGSYSSDGRFELAVGSPAINAGLSGEDCGAFGGMVPYILSGIPAIPTIYDFVAPTIVNGNFNISVSTRSNN